jgi:hypothetical protein
MAPGSVYSKQQHPTLMQHWLGQLLLYLHGIVSLAHECNSKGTEITQ